MSSEWRFRKQYPGEININPIQDEFFRTDTLESIAEALVRESIQNSLDAAVARDKTRVKFTFCSTSNRDINKKRRQLLKSLWPHLNAFDSGLSDIPKETDDVPVLIIEDYGTKGLQGDPRQFEDLEVKGPRNDFYYFWRNVGRGKKEGKERGRWGLGKTVFQAASRINAFFGITTVEGNRALLMGQSILKIHKIGTARYSPYGYYGEFSDHDFALPVIDVDEISCFNEIFPIERLKKQGFSVVIPFPVEEISLESILHSIIKHYSIPILTCDLIVEITDKHGDRILIDLDSIEDHICKLEKKEKDRNKALGILRLAKWGMQQKHPDIEVNAPEITLQPKLEEKLFNDDDLNRCRQRFANNERLAIRFSINVKKKQISLKPSFFTLYLEKDANIEYAQDCFIRNGITIPEVSSLKYKGVRAIVVVNDKELSELLGDAENPAHTDWERSSERLKNKYEHGPSTLSFIKTSPREMVSLLTRPNQDRDKSLLRNIFPMFYSGAEGDSSRKRLGDLLIVSSSPIRIEKVGSGFKISSAPQGDLSSRLIRISAAYELSRGNPFKKYVLNDFDFKSDQISKELKGAAISNLQNNQIIVLIENKEFSIKMNGFDENRDLRIKVIIEGGDKE